MVKTVKLEFQKIYAVTVIYLVSFIGLLNLINSLLNMVGLQTVLDTVLLYGTLIVLLVLCFLASLGERGGISADIPILLIVFVLLYASSFVLHPENRKYLATSLLDYAGNPIYMIFLYSLPCYIFVRKLRDYGYFQKVMVGFSYVIVAMSIFVFLFGGDVHGRQYMTFSYNMLLQLLILTYHRPKRLKMLYRVFLTFSILIFAVGGARGALLSYIAVISIYNFTTMKLERKTFVRLLLMLIALTAFAFFRNQIFTFLIEILGTFSIESRTLEFIVRGQFLDDSYRMEVYTAVWDLIGVLGYGMRGDRVFLEGSYVHNLLLELWMDFGWILGTLIIVLLFVVVIKGMKSKGKPEHFYVFLFLSTGFFNLFLSGSYLNQCPAFFALLGFCVNSIFRKPKHADLPEAEAPTA